MHQKTRRWICRVAFLTLCASPTLWLLGVIGYRSSPWFAQRQLAVWQRVVQEQTGLLAQIGRVSYPRGDIVLFERVQLTDPDSERLVVQLRQAELVRAESRLLVILSQPEVEPGQFDRLCETFHDRLLRGAIRLPMEASAPEVTLKGTPRALTLTDVQCRVIPEQQAIRTAVDFRVAGIPMTAPARIEVVRDRSAWPPTTGWEVQTGPIPLPCSLLAGYFPPLERLGPDCRFAGRAWAAPARDGWNGGLAGQFQAVALEHLIAPFPHKLSGRADVVLDHVAFRGGRLDEAAGTVDCRGGVVSRSLLASFADACRCQKSSRLDRAEAGLIEYDRLAVRFELAAEGLQLHGLCSEDAPGVLIADRHGPLLTELESWPQPAMVLAQALSPAGALQVPATIESDLLLRSLPLPRPATDAPRTAERSGYTPIRLHER